MHSRVNAGGRLDAMGFCSLFASIPDAERELLRNQQVVMLSRYTCEMVLSRVFFRQQDAYSEGKCAAVQGEAMI